MSDLTDPWPAWWVLHACPECDANVGDKCAEGRWVSVRPCPGRPTEQPGQFDAVEVLAILVAVGEPLTSKRIGLRLGIGDARCCSFSGPHTRGYPRSSGPRNWARMMRLLADLRADGTVAKLPHEYARAGATYYALQEGETRTEVQRVATEAMLAATERAAAIKTNGLTDMLDGLRRRT